MQHRLGQDFAELMDTPRIASCFAYVRMSSATLYPTVRRGVFEYCFVSTAVQLYVHGSNILITMAYHGRSNQKHVLIFLEIGINPLAPNDTHTHTHTHTHTYIYIYIYIYIHSRTAQLTSTRCILNIYSTNILTEYFKHVARSPLFFSSRCRLFHNVIFFWFL